MPWTTAAIPKIARIAAADPYIRWHVTVAAGRLAP